MLLIINPWTYIGFVVNVIHLTMTMSASVFKITSIFLSIGPGFCPLAMHITVNKISFVCLLEISEVVDTMPIENPILELPLIVAIILPLKPAISILLTHLKLPLKLAIILLPCLFTGTLHEIIDP